MELLLQQIVNGIVIGVTYALMAMGLNIVFGVLKILNFAHGAFYMFGAFIAFSINQYLGLNYFVSIILALFVLFIFGILFEKIVVEPLIGRELESTFLTTFALSVIL